MTMMQMARKQNISAYQGLFQRECSLDMFTNGCVGMTAREKAGRIRSKDF
jgi:hypothetical protein